MWVSYNGKKITQQIMGVDFCSKTLDIHTTMITLYYLHYCFTQRHMTPSNSFRRIKMAPQLPNYAK